MLVAPWTVLLVAAAALVILVAFRRRARPLALPLADASALGRAARRTALTRAALGALLVALLAGGSALVHRPEEQVAGSRAASSSTVIVLDLSSSISGPAYRAIAKTLERIASVGGGEQRIGLVLFSDVAEEALPPGTRAAELRPFIRFFRPRARRGSEQLWSQAQYPLNPWSWRFSGGTNISTGLALARKALKRDGVERGRVLLLSDLGYAEPDLPRLRRELLAYARDPSVDLRVVALPTAHAKDRALFEHVLGKRNVVAHTASPATGGRTASSTLERLPASFLIVVALLSLALATNELVSAPLSWRQAAPARGA